MIGSTNNTHAMPTMPTDQIPFVCPECKSTSVQVSLPTWCDPDTFEPLEVDVEAEPLYTYCLACEEACKGYELQR